MTAPDPALATLEPEQRALVEHLWALHSQVVSDLEVRIEILRAERSRLVRRNRELASLVSAARFGRAAA
jgi:hypothetical protein